MIFCLIEGRYNETQRWTRGAGPSDWARKEPLADTDARLETVGIALQVALFILQAAPKSLDKDVVEPTAVHADAHAGSFQLVGKRRAGELRPLIGVEG